MSTPNFSIFKSELKNATRSHYEDLSRRNPDQQYYGYSLYTSDDISSFGPVSNHIDAISCDTSDPMYLAFRYGPHEWCNFDDLGLFDGVNRALENLHDEASSFEALKEGILETALQVLVELESEGLFGPRDDERFVVLWVADSDHPIMERAAKELNSPAVYASYSIEYANSI